MLLTFSSLAAEVRYLQDATTMRHERDTTFRTAFTCVSAFSLKLHTPCYYPGPNLFSESNSLGRDPSTQLVTENNLTLTTTTSQADNLTQHISKETLPYSNPNSL